MMLGVYYILLGIMVCALAQVPDIPNLSRGNLTVNIVVKYPEDTLDEFGFFNAPFYVYGNGLCLSWEEGTEMEHTLEDTWELTLTYTQTPAGYGCNDSSVPGFVGVNSQLEYRVRLNDTVDMLGANCGANLPISMSAPFYEESPEIHCNPWFFTTTGTILIERIQGEPDLIQSRNMHFYLPPSFEETIYKQYPVVFAPDIGVGIMDVIFGSIYRMEILREMLDDVIVSQATMEEIIVIGTADYKPDPRNPLYVSDRWDFLGPVNPDHFAMCANGTFLEGCDGCFNVSDIDSTTEILVLLTVGGCGALHSVGGQADTFIDFLLNEVLNFTIALAGDRALTDQQHLGVFGCSLGGLFSCYAAWTRPDMFGHAGCQSSSFWYPQNETGTPQFDFENIFIHDHRENRLFQNIFMDLSIPRDIGWDYEMAESALRLANSMAELPIFEWNENLWLDGYMDKVHGNIECMERAWVFLSEFYRPIGEPRSPLSEPPPPMTFDARDLLRKESPVHMMDVIHNVENMDSVDFKRVLDLLKQNM